MKTFRRRVQRLRPSVRTHYLLTRDLRAAVVGRTVQRARSGHSCPTVLAAAAIHTVWVRSSADAFFDHLTRIAAEQGLDPSWCREQLNSGGQCVLALDQDRVIGMGWITMQNRFWVEEIRHWFAPGPGGCYMFATYVCPLYRGRRVQHLLDQPRLSLAASRGFRWVYAIVESGNRASLRGLARSGFELTARLDALGLFDWSITHCRRLNGQFPAGTIIAPSVSFGQLHLCGPSDT